MTRIEELEQKLNEMNEGLEVGIKKFQEQITDFNNDLRIAKEDFLDELNECQKALAELKESKKEGKWKPNKDEWYWFVTQYGEVKRLYWQDTECYKYLYSRQPIFETKEECERYKLFMDTVKEKSYEFSKEEWENEDIKKYEIYYNYQEELWRIAPSYNCRTLGKTYFKTKESAQYIIDNFKDELIEFWI